MSHPSALIFFLTFLCRKTDWGEFDKACSANLPVYARPAFLRVTQEIPITSTFKHKKGDLVKDGFDPAAMGDDKLFYYNAKDRTVKELSQEMFEQIQSGKIKL